MKVEDWIIGLGAVFVISLVAAAMIPDDVLDRNTVSSAHVIVGVGTAGPGMPNGGPGNPIAGQAANFPSWPSPPAQLQTVAMPGLTRFEVAKSETFRGQVRQIVNRGRDHGWGQIHIWVADGADLPREISLAPDWYLIHLGCPVSESARVRGTAFNFDSVRPDSALYAKTIIVNGKLCRLRNDEGFAFWSNRLR